MDGLTGVGTAARIVDYVIGGWQVAGLYQFYTGTPITLTGSTTSNINNTIKINQTWGSYASDDHNLTPPNFSDPEQVLTSPVTPVTAATIRRLDPTKVVGARGLRVRQPAAEPRRVSQPRLSSGGSFADEELPLRVQVPPDSRRSPERVGHSRPRDRTTSQIGNVNYGLITTAGNLPRQIQLSARFVF